MSALGAITLLPGPSLTRLIDAMIDDNLVHRRVDETDRRRVLVFATRRGTALYTRSRTRIARSDAIAELLADPAGPPARVIELMRLLAPVADVAH